MYLCVASSTQFIYSYSIGRVMNFERTNFEIVDNWLRITSFEKIYFETPLMFIVDPRPSDGRGEFQNFFIRS